MSFTNEKKTKREYLFQLSPFLATGFFVLSMVSALAQDLVYSPPETVIPRAVGVSYTLLLLLMTFSFILALTLLGFCIGWSQRNANDKAKMWDNIRKEQEDQERSPHTY